MAVEKVTLLRATIGGKKLPSKMVEPLTGSGVFTMLFLLRMELNWTLPWASPMLRRLTLTDQTNGLPEHPRISHQAPN